MPTDDLKEFLELKLKVLSGEIKEHINDVNDKARKDFNKRFESQDAKIEEVKEKAESATLEIRFAKRLVYGLAGFVSFIGLPALSGMIKSWVNNV